MNSRQLKLLASLVQHNCNITRTAESVHIAQSAITRQIQLLEEELGRLFVRRGKRLVEPTQLCLDLLHEISSIARAEANIRNIALNNAQTDKGVLRIGTTHTQARFFLPPVIMQFRRLFPEVELLIEQSVPTRLVNLLMHNTVDLAICTEAISTAADLTSIRCYSWTHALVVRRDHPLAGSNAPLQLAQLQTFDLITYTHQFAGGSHIRKCFQQVGLEPHIVLAAADSDIIKTYVQLGLGVGIIAAMSVDPARDTDLVALPLGHLFGENITRIAWRTSAILPRFAETCKHMLIRQGTAHETDCGNHTNLPG